MWSCTCSRMYFTLNKRTNSVQAVGLSVFCIVSCRALVCESSYSLCGLSRRAQFGVVVLQLLFEPSCSVCELLNSRVPQINEEDDFVVESSSTVEEDEDPFENLDNQSPTTSDSGHQLSPLQLAKRKKLRGVAEGVLAAKRALEDIDEVQQKFRRRMSQKAIPVPVAGLRRGVAKCYDHSSSLHFWTVWRMGKKGPISALISRKAVLI
ncbi:hypothetical protein Taro_048196, partial [Colocasia esculenta]|nr:hypothetical protein [Colocasia esculenta]